jgi:uncharacterized coiled-coil protein SlyX
MPEIPPPTSLEERVQILEERSLRQGKLIDDLIISLNDADNAFKAVRNEMRRLRMKEPVWSYEQEEAAEEAGAGSGGRGWCPVCAENHPLENFDEKATWPACLQRHQEYHHAHGDTPGLADAWQKSLYWRQHYHHGNGNWEWQVREDELRQWGLRPRNQ